MAYVKINQTGCGIHKNRAKLRLDFFLNPDDPNYERYPDAPFHSHFIYPDKDVSDADIKAEIERCLNYFYSFHQYCWAEGKQSIEEWQKVPRQAGQVRCPFIKGKPEDLSANEAKVQDILSRVREFQAGVSKVPPQDLNIGEKGTIDIGPGAIDRAGVAPEDYTYIDFANPANETGMIDTFEVWADETLGLSTKVGTFYGSGTTYSNRDGETIGTVEAGAKRTFSGLDIDVTSGDFAGIFFASGSIERDWTGGANYGFDAGDQFGTGEQTYSILADDAISIYGTGTGTEAVPVVETDACTDVKPTSFDANGDIIVSGGATKRGFHYSKVFDGFEWGGDTDPLDDSGGAITWTIVTAGDSKAEIDEAQHYSGTRSARLLRDGTNHARAYFTQSPVTATQVISTRIRKDDASQIYYLHGNGTYRITIRIDPDGTVNYYDTTAHEVGSVSAGAWFRLDVKNANWATQTYDIYLGGLLIKSGAGMMTDATYSEQVAWANTAGTDSEVWLDEVAVWDVEDEDGSFSEGEYSLEITGLDPLTTYYVQAFAKNSVGYGYGDVVSQATLTTMGRSFGFIIG